MSSAEHNGKYYVIVLLMSVCALLIYYQATPIGSVEKIKSYYVPKTHVRNAAIVSRGKCYNDTRFDYDRSFSSLEIPSYYRKLNNCSTSNVTKYIFTFHDFWGWTRKDGLFKNCPVNACVMFNDFKRKPIEQYDAVIFSMASNTIPERRSPDQKYIFFSLESPYNTGYDTYNAPHFFNWTMTYRRDADIHFPYFVIRKQKTNYRLPTHATIKTKTKMAAWFVSNCQTDGTRRRQKYVEELSRYIQVDVYGACGTLKCTDNCYEMVERDYLFYLSFENSMCFDYVTEKLFNVLNYNVVPVVMGYSDYESIVPPNSVIDVDRFPGPKHLAAYLLKISNDPDLFLKYLEWKKRYVVLDQISSTDYTFCQLCDLLHRPLTHSSYNAIEEWFRGYNCYLYS